MPNWCAGYACQLVNPTEGKLETRDVKLRMEGNVDGLSSKTPQTQNGDQLNKSDAVPKLKTEERREKT